MVKGMTRRAFLPLGAAILALLAIPFQKPVHAQPTPGAAAIPDGDSASAEEALVFGHEIGIEDPGGRALEPLYAALRRAERDGDHQARVMVYGASHVAADFFTNVLRERLQARFGDAGHGFIMPAPPWRRYRHLGGLTVEGSRHWEALRVRASTREVDALGVAGLAVETSSASAWGRIDTGDAPAGRFVLHYLKQPGGGGLDVQLDGQRVARIHTGSDALEAGVEALHTAEGHHVLEVRARGDGPVRLFGVSVERERPGVIVDNMGINGARAVSHLLWNEEIHAQYMRRMAPDLVVLAYGTNESGDDDQPIEEYEVALRRVVARVRGTVPDAACLLVGPSDRPMREDGALVDRPRTHAVVAVQRRVSRDLGCAFFDLVEFGGGPLSMVQWAATEPAYAQPDYVHFTLRGYLRLGEILHGAMMAGFEDTEAPPGELAAVPRAASPAGSTEGVPSDDVQGAAVRGAVPTRGAPEPSATQ